MGSEMFIYSFFDHCVACRILVLPPGIEPLTSAMKARILFFFDVLYFLLNYIIPHNSLVLLFSFLVDSGCAGSSLLHADFL